MLLFPVVRLPPAKNPMARLLSPTPRLPSARLPRAEFEEPVVFESGGWVRYYSCYVWDANESLSYLELLPGTEYQLN